MKVKDLIEGLQRNYSPDDYLYVEYWDKEIAQSFSDPDFPPMTSDQWESVVDIMVSRERYYLSLIADAISEAVEEVQEVS